MTDFNRYNECDVLTKKREVVRLATQMIEGSLGVIEGCTNLARISHDLEFLGSIENFNIFVEVASETDHSPLASARGLRSFRVIQEYLLLKHNIKDKCHLPTKHQAITPQPTRGRG